VSGTDTVPNLAVGPAPGGISKRRHADILLVVTKRLIDVDDEKLQAVQALLDTATLKATVNAALDEVLALHARRQALLAERGVDLAALAGTKARRAAWG
jgi:Arc/MetJ family transcription regulator